MTFSYFKELGKKLKTVLGADEYVLSGYDIESTVYSNNANYFTDDSGAVANIDSDNFVGAIQSYKTFTKRAYFLPRAPFLRLKPCSPRAKRCSITAR